MLGTPKNPRKLGLKLHASNIFLKRRSAAWLNSKCIAPAMAGKEILGRFSCGGEVYASQNSRDVLEIGH